jgi:TPR repeat protein
MGGHAMAQDLIARYYYAGNRCLEFDLDKAFFLFHKAALQGDPDAMFELGNIYQSGDFIKADLKKGFKWLLQSAELDCPDAQCHVGVCYAKGVGTERNAYEAVFWLCRAREAGSSTAEYALKEYLDSLVNNHNSKAGTRM